MRYCKDCKHFELPTYTGNGGRPYCARFKKTFTSSEHPVFGPTVNYSAPECEVARGEGGQCGPQARFWVPRDGTQAWYDLREAERDKIVREAREELAPLNRKSVWQWFRELFA